MSRILCKQVLSEDSTQLKRQNFNTMVKQLWATQLHSLAAYAAMVKLLLLGAAVGALATSCEDGWYLANYVSRQRRSPPAGTRHCAVLYPS